MNLRQKSLLITVVTSVVSIVGAVFVIYQLLMVRFQEIENQRVERNIRRIEAVIEDRYSQLVNNLADWTIWDDAYEFMINENKEFVDSNISQESFASSGVDEALFINKEGKLILSFRLASLPEEEDFPQDIYKHFMPGSELFKFDKSVGYGKGILQTDGGLILYTVREVFKSSGIGEANGSIVFGRYFDKKLINAMKDLTQFEASIFLWDDTTMTSDFLDLKNAYSMGQKSLVRILNDQTISGYLVVEDVFGKPVAIVRSDVKRDITIQGRAGLTILMFVMVMMVIMVNGGNFLLFTNVIIRKILVTMTDVDKLAISGEGKLHTTEGKSVDEIDKLRNQINLMLESVEKEKQKGESLLDLINALVVILNPNGDVLMINKKGLEMLGYTRDDVIGKNWMHTFVPDESIKEVEEIFERVLKEDIKDNEVIENEILTKDNKIISISWHNSVIKDGGGNVVSTLSLGDDITQKKEEEIKREEYGKELERLNGAMVGRELRMIEMKEEINRLRVKNKI